MSRICAATFLIVLGLEAAHAALQAVRFEPPGGWIRSPALVTIENPNAVGTVFYTWDGADPRGPFGNVATNALAYAGPLSVNRSQILRARVKSGSDWSELAAASFTADQDFSKLIFTELMYHPRTGVGNGKEFEEFVELKNVGPVPLDLSGLELREDFILVGDVFFRCPPGTVIPPGGFFVLPRSTNYFHQAYPGVPVHGEMSHTFRNAVGRPALRSTNGASAAHMVYDSHAPWAVVPDNHGYFGAQWEVGFSLVRTTLDPAADPTDNQTWRASAERFGSPGADDPEPGDPRVYVNELLTRPGAGLLDTVELYNPNPIDAPIGGWWLSDERNQPFRYLIPPGMIVPALGYLVLDETDFNTGTNSLSFNSDHERCYLFSGDESGRLTGYSHGFRFAAGERGVSFGRSRSSDGRDSFLPQLTRTFGAPNGGPAMPPVMITEFSYHSEGFAGEFIELRNTLSDPLTLWDPDYPGNGWGLAHDRLWAHPEVYLPIPPNTIMPPLGHLLLVSGDPEEFRAAHDVPADVPIFHWPAEFTLPDRRGTLQLFRPAGLDDHAERPRYVMVDEVNYDNQFPWDPGAAGGGQSLERIGFTPYGSDPTHWRASPTGGSPGRDNSGNVSPLVWAGGDQTAILGRANILQGALRDDGWPGTILTSWWSQVSGPADVEFNIATRESVTVTFSQPGTYEIRFSAHDGTSIGEDAAVIEVVASPYELWRTAYFTEPEAGDDSVSGREADPDHDGWSNAQECLFATEPKLLASRPALQTRVVNGFFEVTWIQRADYVDVEFVPERADRLEGPWFGGEGLFWREATPLAEPGLVTITLRSILPAAQSGQQYIRLN